MILRRFTKHVTDQNWFAVGLDVLVVITGIFLGMQVTDWNDEREKQLGERVIIDNVLQDFTVIDDQTKQLAQASASNVHLLSIVLKSLENGIVTSEDEEDFKSGLGSLAMSYPPPQSSGTVEELMASGGLANLSDNKLRNLLFEFQSELELIVTQLAKFEDLLQMNDSHDVAKIHHHFEGGADAKKLADLMSGDDALEQLATYTFEDKDYWMDQFVESYDFEAMVNDPLTHRTFSKVRMLNMGTVYWAKLLHQRSSAVQLRLLELKGNTP